MDEIELADMRMDALELLSRLPGEDQLTFVLYHYLGLTYREIATLKGCSRMTVHRRLRAISKALTGLACDK